MREKLKTFQDAVNETVMNDAHVMKHVFPK